jgi:hypothetical protein
MQTSLLPLKKLKINLAKQKKKMLLLRKENNLFKNEIKDICATGNVKFSLNFDNAIFTYDSFYHNSKKLTNISLKFTTTNKSEVSYTFSLNKTKEIVLKYEIKTKKIKDNNIDKILNFNNEVNETTKTVKKIPEKLLKNAILKISNNSKIITSMFEEFFNTENAVNNFSVLSKINSVFVPIQDFSVTHYLYDYFNIDSTNNTEKDCNEILKSKLCNKPFYKPFFNVDIHYEQYRTSSYQLKVAVINNEIKYFFDTYSAGETRSTPEKINNYLSNMVSFNNEILHDFKKFPEILKDDDPVTGLNMFFDKLVDILQIYINSEKIKQF